MDIGMRKFLNKKAIGEGMFPQKDAYDPLSTKRVTYDLFAPNYFTAEDISIYIGDIWIDEVTAISYQMNENVYPIYGYKSYTYDAIARGNRIVQGQVIINFQIANYLREVIANSDAVNYHLQKGLDQNDFSFSDLKDYKLKDILGSMGFKGFEDAVNVFKKEVWGLSDDEIELDNHDGGTYFLDMQEGVEIRVTFGPDDEARAKSMTSDVYKQRLAYYPDTTTEVINGVQFVDKSIETGIDISPHQVQEVYSFIARDISGVSLREAMMDQAISSNLGQESMSQNLDLGRPKILIPGKDDVGPTTY